MSFFVLLGRVIVNLGCGKEKLRQTREKEGNRWRVDDSLYDQRPSKVFSAAPPLPPGLLISVSWLKFLTVDSQFELMWAFLNIPKKLIFFFINAEIPKKLAGSVFEDKCGSATN